MNFDEKIAKFRELLNKSKNIVVLSGAGLSTNSGIPDFRSASGIYNQKLNTIVSPEELISHTFFIKYPKDFYDFYFDKLIYEDAKPNSAHYFFAKLEKENKIKGIITQNIDNLHQMAGSKKVIELHGNVYDNYCMKCHKYYPLKDLSKSGIPYCDCGGIIKPDVVLYEESLKQENLMAAVDALQNSDLLIIIGTSLVVYPAAGLVRYYTGKDIVVINKSVLQYQEHATIAFNDDIKDVMDALDY